MKTKITFLNTACRGIVVAAVFLFTVVPAAMAQDPEVPWYIAFSGHFTEHEGLAGWDADGTGDEPYGVGHQVPITGFDNMPYYSASRDYDDIDPDPSAAGAHLLDSAEGFPQFLAALEANDYLISEVKLKFGLSDLGDDMEGADWFMIGINNTPHSLYYGNSFYLVIQNEPLIWGMITFNDCYFVEGAGWDFITSYFKPDSAWSINMSADLKEIGRAFLADIGNEEIRLMVAMNSEGGFNIEGRNGAYHGVDGIIEKGLPELPYMGLVTDHQGMAGWNADGTGPEEPGDGHGAQRYYVASRDYGDIDPDPDAAFGHFLPEMKGFLNLELQMAYRGYSADAMVIKHGLSSLGNDIMGLDWGFENGTDYWCNYYDIDYLLEIDGEVIIRGLIDTSHSWMNADPVYWYCDATLDRPRDGSAPSSPDAQIIAAAFMKDMECRKMINDVQVMTYDTNTFSGNGRYDGGFFNLETARLVFKNAQNCCFVQIDTLGGGLINHTDWILEYSPYFLDNNLVVLEGHTLNIEPGVKVAIRGPYFIDIKGNIEAIGTDSNNITFTHSNPLVKWNSIRIPWVEPETDSSLFSYCIFEHAHAVDPEQLGYNSGAAVKIGDFDKVRFSHCIFRDNLADWPGTLPPSGAAIGLWTASPLIEYCSFYDNIADYGGAIICHEESNPIIKYSLFHGNRALVDGGAIIVYDRSAPTLLNNTITGNYAFNNGGGMDLYSCTGDSVIFINNIIWNNTSINAGQQVSLSSFDNIASFKYNDIGGGLEGIGPGSTDHIYYADNNIDTDPIFCFPEDNMFTLEKNSPCQYSGMGGTYIGAFDWDCYDFIPEKGNNEGDLIFYPNPATAGPVSVSFFMGNPGQIRLEIYNLTGEKVAEPVNDHLNAGEYRMAISTGELPSGIYIGRLTSGNKSKTCKLIIMR